MVKSTKSTTTPIVPPTVDTIPTPTLLPVEKVKKTPSEKKTKTVKPLVEALEKEVVMDGLIIHELAEALEAPVAIDPTTSSSTQDMPSKIADFNNKYNQVVSMLSSLKQSFKSIEKTAQRDWRVAQKALAKKTKKAEKRSPSGFVRPCLISDEMARFLELEVGTMIARTTVSKLINTYIRTNNLQDKTHGRNINPDEKLATLLNVQPDSPEKLTYFNLQRYMKHHFIKAVPVTV
jgi:chromatin remodeling complex protein RSC6